MVFEVKHLVHVEEVVEVVDGPEIMAAGERRLGPRRPPEEEIGRDVGRDGADLRGREAYAAGLTLWRTEPAPSTKKLPNSVCSANIATASSSFSSMMPGTASSPSMWQ